MKRQIFRTAVAAVLVLTVSIPTLAVQMLVPVGRVVGLSLSEGSVTVVAFDEEYGGVARDAGVQIGDDIVSVDGAEINSAQDLLRSLQRSGGSVRITVCRGGKERQVKLEPAVTKDGPRLGVFIREGVTGIGTITYYDPETGTFGALGHGVSSGGGQLAAMESGTVYRASVVGVKAGQVGKPGQLKGAVSAGEAIGSLRCNTSFGVFGSCEEWSGEALPVAKSSEVKTGPAQILSNISGDAVETFSVEILKLYPGGTNNGRDLMLQVTDPALLETTGGIVAGMSGSPVLQDGKIIGAVTHVLVNDPTTGYGIFIENMLDAAG